MKILILGSNKGIPEGKLDDFNRFCENLGKELSRYRLQLLLCSPFRDSADRAVVTGISKSKEGFSKINLELHFPNNPQIEKEWESLLKNNVEFNSNNRKIVELKKHPFESINNEHTYAWLFSQMQALESANFVIVIGGNIDGSASLLLRMAEAKNKLVIPIFAFEGIALHFYNKNFYSLSDLWGDDIDLFGKLENVNILVKTIIEGPIFRKKSNDKIYNPTFFLSYPRARPQEADFVEMQLRRRGYIVIRDENDINESNDISNAIKENINKADVFIAVWSKEYACSPWCYDELTIAINKKKVDKYAIWILCLDDTRIVHPEARNLLFFKVKTREEIEGRVALLLEKYRK